MDPSVYDSWKTIEQPSLSSDGNWINYTLSPGKGDPLLVVHELKNKKDLLFQRASNGQFSHDAEFLVFTLHPHLDSIRALKRRKVDEKDLPKDTLCILHLKDNQLTKIPHLHNVQLPEKYSGYLAYQISPPSEENVVEENSKEEKSEEEEIQEDKKAKECNEENGYPLIIRALSSTREDTFSFVTEYVWAEETPTLAFIRTGDTLNDKASVHILNPEDNNPQMVASEIGKFHQLAIYHQGTQLSFLAHLDTTQNEIKNTAVYFWKKEDKQAKELADSTLSIVPDNWIINEHMKPQFSEDGSKLFFGVSPKPLLRDTTLLEEEIVNVEVWSYKDGRLYTQQEVREDEDKKRAYQVVYRIEEEAFTQLGSIDIPETKWGKEGNADVVLGRNPEPYLQEISWVGDAREDIFLVDVANGQTTRIAEGVLSSPDPQFSPEATFVYWYSRPDSIWMIYQVAKREVYPLTHKDEIVAFDEINDRPMHPYAYGIAGWTENDEHLLLYDRYDIWKIDPLDPGNPINLTNGRSDQLKYRYVSLDPEEKFIGQEANILLHVFNEQTRQSGYARFDLSNGELSSLVMEDVHFSNKPIKALSANALITTKESYRMFPDLIVADTNFQQMNKVSEANPQQAEYKWGNVELYSWVSTDGQLLEGMLVKPEDFDSTKKYPLLVNFYEKSSALLHRHRAPKPPRSSINYPYYNSRGYIIFNPDVPYKIGYPGESAYNSVVSGVTALINEGFIDKERIGIQGHSWGGYQISYLLTRTNLFACAEAGAPVVNMFSAYGGIRWSSGMSRMFQYEQTQSRIGGTIWEYPLRYIENSPLFTADKIQTPVLILHNDEDGAVPWYQGIEFFVALRRLGKPSWLLNYNGEPHGLTEWQNKVDFSLRMQQFFDHYLMNAPKPMWMEKGVSPLEKGIKQGFEVEEEITQP